MDVLAESIPVELVPYGRSLRLCLGSEVLGALTLSFSFSGGLLGVDGVLFGLLIELLISGVLRQGVVLAQQHICCRGVFLLVLGGGIHRHGRFSVLLSLFGGLSSLFGFIQPGGGQ